MSEPVTAADLAEALRTIRVTRSVDVLGVETLLARYDAQQAAKAQECTGVAAVWCPRCGDCTCSDCHEFTSTPDDKCPLHGLTSTHAEPQQTEVSKPERAYELLLRHESQRGKRSAISDELQRTKDELAKVIKAYDSAMVRLSEETIRRIALNREDRIPGPIKPALSEVEQIAVKLLAEYTQWSDTGKCSHDLIELSEQLREALRKRGAL